MKKPYQQKLYLLLVVLMISSIGPLSAQSVRRQSIGTLGAGIPVSSGVSVRQTVGQPYFSGASVGNEVTVLQGFQQPFGGVFTTLQMPENLDLTMFPNPAVHTVNIQSPVMIEAARLQVFDIQGRTVLEETLGSGDRFTIDCRQLIGGLYFVNLSGQNKANRFTSKLIINK